MRVLHVVTAFPRVREDVITPWLVELIKRQRAQGDDVDVFTSSYRGLGNQVFDGIPVYRFRYFLRRWENLTHEETAPDRMRRSLLYRMLPLWFVTAGYIVLRGAIDEPGLRARYSAVLGILGALLIPFIHLSVYLFRTLHPMPIVLKPDRPSLPTDMLVTFLSFVAACTLLCAALIRARYRYGLQRDALLALEAGDR